MAVYAVGDIQGCYDPLRKLLDQVKFDPSSDTLYCVGDLVNRGPKSLKTLHFLMSLDDACVSVLGNHDIHLLAMIYGLRQPRATDTLDKILAAPDVSQIGDWLRSKPLLEVNKKRRMVVCHAGIYPWWSLKFARKRCNEVEAVFKDKEQCIDLLGKIYSNKPLRWSSDLTKTQRCRFTINALTRMRFCSPKGRLNFKDNGYVGMVTDTRVPWFDFNNPGLSGWRVVFGHWSSLGLLIRPKLLGLDTGCVWGRELTLAKIPKSIDGPIKLYSQKNN